MEDNPNLTTAADFIDVAPAPKRGLAPVWHTLLLVGGIALLSIEGVRELSGPHAGEANRLQTYGFTMITELLMVAWVYFGLRLRKIPFGSIFGSVSRGFRGIAVDIGFALLFWIASIMVLGTIGLTWNVAESVIEHKPLIPKAGKTLEPDKSQQETLRTLTGLVPRDGREMAAWVLLCIVAGFAEEIVFRGYFQNQFIAWSHGAVAVGVALSALMFGSAHGYQGVRNMVMLSVFGALFSGLALFRRSLRAGIFAHSWHDIFVGLTLALLHAHHRI